MAVKAGVESANEQGLYDPDSMQSRIVEILEIIKTLADEYNVDTSAPAFSGGNSGGPFADKPTKGVAFEVDGTKWFDYRGAKDAGTVSPNFPDFKAYNADGSSESLWLQDQDGNPDPDAETLAKLADVSA